MVIIFQPHCFFYLRIAQILIFIEKVTDLTVTETGVNGDKSGLGLGHGLGLDRKNISMF